VALEIPRNDAWQPIQEARVSCWTGRAGGPAGRATVGCDYRRLLPGGALGPLQTTAPSPPGNFHTLHLGDLTPGGYYQFLLTATAEDGSGNTSQSQVHRFTQTPGPIPPGPVLSAITVSAITATGATVTWSTATAQPGGQVNYSPNPNLVPLSVASEPAPAVTNHSVTLAGLTAGTRYYFRVFQSASDGSSTLSGLRSFVTAVSQESPEEPAP